MSDETKTSGVKNAVEKLVSNIAELFKVRSLITVLMTVGLLYMIMGEREVPQALLAIFSTAYGSIMTYFFTHKSASS